ncbi:VOC family protein [Pseudonocardia sp. HH130629-09]|nr:VOC family protein [Pseudonocardia sp. HH130629-09]
MDDYDEAIDFFTHALGFELVEDSPAQSVFEKIMSQG